MRGGPKNIPTHKELSRLLDVPKSKWRKEDWANATIFLASEPTGIIAGIQYKSNERKLFARINYNESKRRRGRPETRPLVQAKKIIEVVERQRQKLADKRKVDTSKITDKDVAMSFAVLTKTDKTIRFSKYKLCEKYQSYIKYMKIKAKSG